MPLIQLLVKWMKSQYPKFKFISIQLNNGYASAMPVDGNNVGPSVIVALGDFTGGQLWTYDPSGSIYRQVTRRPRGFPEVKVGEKLPGQLVSIHNRPLAFDGTLPHGTEKQASASLLFSSCTDHGVALRLSSFEKSGN